MNVTREEVLEILIHDLPRLVSEQPELRYALIGAVAETFARRDELHAVLEEIKTLREDFNTRFDEHAVTIRQLIERMEEHSVALRQLTERMEEHSVVIQQLTEQMEEHSVALRQLTERMEEHSVVIQQLTERTEEHSVAIRQLTERMEEHSVAIQALREDFNARFEEHAVDIKELRTAIGGLGARWGLMSEEVFRDGMAGILAEVGFQVERFWQMDTEGYVFGRPDQVEIDVAVHDGQVILMGIKSSVSRADVTIFQRKVEFYAQVKDVEVSRRIIVSPFVDSRADKRARAMGIEVYTSGYEVPT